MKIAVTGAGGFIGRYVVERLVQRGDQVLAIDCVPNACAWAGDRITFLQSSLDSKDALREAFSGLDAIVHLAARRGGLSEDVMGFRPFFEANIQVTENVLQAAAEAGVTKVCQASSIAVYSSDNRTPYTEDQPPIPRSLYGLSKLACEHIATLLMRRFPIRVTSLRLAQVFGDGEREGLMLVKFVRQAYQKEVLRVWGEGKSARDIVYVRDVVGAIERAVAPDTPCGVFNIGGGKAYTVLEIAQTVNKVFDNEGQLVLDPSQEERDEYFFMDCSLAETHLGWKRQWTLQSGLEDMKKLYEQSKG